MARHKGRGADTVPVSVVYDRGSERIIVSLSNGAQLAIPAAIIPRVADASDEDRSAVSITTDAPGIQWERLDLAIYVPLLIGMLMGERAWRQAAASAFAGIKSPAKARAARANGAKGGRPRKHTRA
jgi:hypothetical protein